MLDERPRRIVLATDGSPSAEAALDLVCALRLRPVDSVDVVSVAVPSAVVMASGFADISASAADEAAAETARLAAERLARCGIQAEGRVAGGPIAMAVVDTACALDADLIVAGSRGHGLILGALLGSTARALARSSPLPVLVVRDRRAAPQRVLVAVDGSPDSRAAIDALAAIPLPRGAEIVVLNVVPPTRTDTARSVDLVSLVAARLPPTFTTRVEVARGDVAERILERAAALGSDLIVLGSRGTPSGPLQGSTADRVLSGAHCSVLVARAAERAAVRDRLVHPTTGVAGAA